MIDLSTVQAFVDSNKLQYGGILLISGLSHRVNLASAHLLASALNHCRLADSHCIENDHSPAEYERIIANLQDPNCFVLALTQSVDFIREAYAQLPDNVRYMRIDPTKTGYEFVLYDKMGMDSIEHVNLEVRY